MCLIQQVFLTSRGGLWPHASSLFSLLQISGILIPPQATQYHKNFIPQCPLLSPPLSYLRKMSTSFSFFSCLLFFVPFFRLKICLITDVASISLHADNPLSLFLDQLVNETTTAPPESVTNEEETFEEPTENNIPSIKVTTQ